MGRQCLSDKPLYHSLYKQKSPEILHLLITATKTGLCRYKKAAIIP